MEGLKFNHPLSKLKCLLFGDVGFVEEYMAGNIKAKTSLLDLIGSNRTRRLMPYIPRKLKDASEPYDEPAGIYEPILGESMAYTCGNFDGQDITLDEAQYNKYKMHYDWLDLNNSGLRLIECGAGWGGFLNYVHWKPSLYPIITKGINISKEQIKFSKERFGIYQELMNWNEYQPVQKFNRFTSQGMPEHVGKKHLPDYFQWVSSILEPKSIGTLQFYSRPDNAPKSVDKFMFPGAYPPTFNEVHKYAKQTGLSITDVKVRDEDYAKTIEKWYFRLLGNTETIIKAGGSIEQIRKKELLFAACIHSFRSGNSQLIQLRFVKV